MEFYKKPVPLLKLPLPIKPLRAVANCDCVQGMLNWKWGTTFLVDISINCWKVLLFNIVPREAGGTIKAELMKTVRRISD